MGQFHNQNTFQDDVTLEKNVIKKGTATADNHVQNKGEVKSYIENDVIAQTLDNSSNKAPSNDLLSSELAKKEQKLTVASDSTDIISLSASGDQTEISINLGGSQILHITNNTITNFSTFLSAITYNADGFEYNSNQYTSGVLVLLDNSNVDPLQNQFIYTGGSDSNTSVDANTSFKNLSDKYDSSTIRQLFSVSGVGIAYDNSTGVTSLVFDNTASGLNGGTIQHNATFASLVPSGDKINDALVALESLANTNNSNLTSTISALDSRVTNLVGSSTSDLGTFSGSTISDNVSVKAALQSLESASEAATSDRASIRSEFAATDSILQSNIDSEAATRAANDASLQNNINVETIARQSADAQLTADLNSEIVNRQAADANLQNQINALASSDLRYIGTVEANGKFQASNSDDSRNGNDFVDLALTAGEHVVVASSQNLTFPGDNITSPVVEGNVLLVKTTVTANNLKSTDIEIINTNDRNLDVTNIGSSTIEIDTDNHLAVIDGSIGSTQLDSTTNTILNQAVQDINNNVDLTSSNVDMKSAQVADAPVNNTDVVRKLDLDNKSAIFSSIDLSSSPHSHTIDTSSLSFNVDNAIIQAKNGNAFIGVDITTDNASNEIVIQASGQGVGSLTDVKVLVLSCN